MAVGGILISGGNSYRLLPPNMSPCGCMHARTLHRWSSLPVSVAWSTYKRRQRLRVSSIGFDLSGEAPTRSVEKRAADLCKDTSSLLLFQSAVEAKPAQAFINVLINLQRKSVQDILSSYGEFYREMASTQSNSWQDYLLDEASLDSSERQRVCGKNWKPLKQRLPHLERQTLKEPSADWLVIDGIMSGRKNVWAKAVANGDSNPASRAAVEHDLDILMRLALGDRALASMVKEAHSDIPEDWLTAASAICAASTSQENEPQHTRESSGNAAESPSADIIQGPPTLKEREQWRAKIAGEWRWSQAVADLEHFFSRHGVGLTQRYSMLEWKNEALQGFTPYHPGPSNEFAEEIWASALEGTIREHLTCQRRSAVMISMGDPKSLAWSALVNSAFQEFAQNGLRIVVTSAATLTGGHSSMHGLARALGQHKRMRFLVVAGLEGLTELSLAQEAEVTMSLSEERGIWPANALPVVVTKHTGGRIKAMYEDGGMKELGTTRDIKDC